MKKLRFTEEQITYALRQVESGTPVPDVCRQMGGSEASFYLWKKRYGNLGVWVANSHSGGDRGLKQTVTMLRPSVAIKQCRNGGGCAGALRRRGAIERAVDTMRVVKIPEFVKLAHQDYGVPEECPIQKGRVQRPVSDVRGAAERFHACHPMQGCTAQADFVILRIRHAQLGAAAAVDKYRIGPPLPSPSAS